jgi:hypothetical protein
MSELLFFHLRGSGDDKTWGEVVAEEYEPLYAIIAEILFPTCMAFQPLLRTPKEQSLTSSSSPPPQIQPFRARLRERLQDYQNRVGAGVDKNAHPFQSSWWEQLAWVSVPKTFYELFFLREYLRARVNTPFISFSGPEECFEEGFYMGCAPRWFLDHKTLVSPGKLTEEKFMEEARKIIKSDYLCLLQFEMNNKVIHFLAQSPFFSASLLATIASTLSHRSIAPEDWPKNTWKEVLWERTGLLLNDLEAVADPNSPLGRAYVTWPLRSPNFEENFLAAFHERSCRSAKQGNQSNLHQIFHAPFPHSSVVEETSESEESVPKAKEAVPDEEEEQEEENETNELNESARRKLKDLWVELEHVYKTYVVEDVALLEKKVKQCIVAKQQQLAENVTSMIGELLSGCLMERRECKPAIVYHTHEDLKAIYLLLMNQLYPQLLTYATLEEHNTKLLKRLKRHLSPVSVIDPCVHCFTRPQFLSKGKQIIWKALALEIEIQMAEAESRGQEGEQFFLLYRGSLDHTKDSPLLAERPDDPVFNARMRRSNPCRAHSLSYGASLFAGILQDLTATPFIYMRQKKVQRNNGCYALKIPLSEYIDSTGWARCLLFVPPLPSLVQLNSIGEMFHPRSKVYLCSHDSKTQDKRESTSLGSYCNHEPIAPEALRSCFVSGILGCSYVSLPTFLLSRDYLSLVTSSANLDHSVACSYARKF